VIRVGLVGLGAMGRNHLRVLSELDSAVLAGVCDQDAAAVAAAGSRYGVAGYSSWRELLDREEMDALVIAVPTRFHLEVGHAALTRGLHVLVEKPIAATLEEGRALVDAATRAHRLLAVGHIERFNPAVRELQKAIAAGELGRVFQIQARRDGPFPARIRDVGVVIDLATHDLDVMCHIAGEDVERLYAETERRIHTEHEDMLNALLKFSSGAVGVLQVNWLTPTKIRELSVLGERGLFVVDYLNQELTLFKNAEVEGAGNVRGVTEGDVMHFPIVKAEPLRLELESFIGAVERGGPVEVDGEAGLRALHLALALMTSASEGRTVSGAELRF
jgi:UDP-N-acetylglucosamine 3-dehydrogenase